MRLPDFDYYAPETVEEACKLLVEKGENAVLFSGGTDLLPKMKHDLLAPEAVIAIKKIKGLNTIEYIEGTGLVIGGTATLNDLVFSEVVASKYPAISHAASKMAANQIRHLGTVAGNIGSAVPSADVPPILMALNAKLVIQNASGERSVPVEEVFVGPMKTNLGHDDIITKVIVPDDGFTGSAYHKFALRKSGALATVGVACAVKVENGVITDARIALGAVSPTPVRAKEAEKALIGNKPSDELYEKAAEIAKGECKPISDHRASAEYRSHLVCVYTKRMLKKAVENGNKF